MSSTNTSSSSNDDSWLAIECTEDLGYGGRIGWVSVCLPRNILRIFLSRAFPCGLCATEAVGNLKLLACLVANYWLLIED